MITIGIVGGGASGMFAALTAAKHGARVIIFEGNDRIGKKILSTGNGKCNLGNLDMDSSKYHSAHLNKMDIYLNRLGSEAMVDCFHRLGLFIVSKNGYLYPKSEQASSVLDILRYAIERNNNIEVIYGAKINNIGKYKNNCFRLFFGSHSYTVDRLILACGGKAASKTGSDGSGYLLAKKFGHNIIPVVPALVQLRCEEKWFKAVAGVRTEAALSVKNSNTHILESGELQLTDYGISGIPVFQLSRHINYMLRSINRVEICIDFYPNITLEELKNRVTCNRNMNEYCTVEEYFSGVLNKKLMTVLIKTAGLKLNDCPAKVGISKLLKVCELIKEIKVHVIGSNSFEQAQVCAGGVCLNELDDNLQSQMVKNLYMIGEMVDVDGRCGGYNLHWAWCSGYIAGTQASK